MVTKRGTGASCGRIEVVEASHPVLDGANLEASGRLLQAVGVSLRLEALKSFVHALDSE